MRITDVKTWLVKDGVYLKIETDEGAGGYGEATNPFMPQNNRKSGVKTRM